MATTTIDLTSRLVTMRTPVYTAVAYADGLRWRAAVQIGGVDIWVSAGRFSTYSAALAIADGRARALRGDHERMH